MSVYASSLRAAYCSNLQATVVGTHANKLPVYEPITITITITITGTNHAKQLEWLTEARFSNACASQCLRPAVKSTGLRGKTRWKMFKVAPSFKPPAEQ